MSFHKAGFCNENTTLRVDTDMGGAMRNRRAAPLQPSGNSGAGAGRWTETVGGPKSPPWFLVKVTDRNPKIKYHPLAN